MAKMKAFPLLRYAHAAHGALEGCGTDHSEHRAGALISYTDSFCCWAKSFTASVLVQCIQNLSVQEDSKWILYIYFSFNKGNLSNYLHCIVIYKVIKSWNNWLNAIAKLFIEHIPQRSRDTSCYQTCSTSGFFSKLSPNARRQSGERKDPLCSEGRLWKLVLLESNQRDTTGLS